MRLWAFVRAWEGSPCSLRKEKKIGWKNFSISFNPHESHRNIYLPPETKCWCSFLKNILSLNSVLAQRFEAVLESNWYCYTKNARPFTDSGHKNITYWRARATLNYANTVIEIFRFCFNFKMQTNLKFSISNHLLQLRMIPPGRERHFCPGTTDLICTRNCLLCLRSYCHLKIGNPFFFSSSTAGALSCKSDVPTSTFYLWFYLENFTVLYLNGCFNPHQSICLLTFREKKGAIKTSN